MKRLFTCLFFFLYLSSNIQAQSTLELFPQSNTIGINVTLNPGDPEMDCSAQVGYKYKGSDTVYMPSFGLARVRNEYNQLSGALFNASDNASTRQFYVEITLSDKTTPALDGKKLYGMATATTVNNGFTATYNYYVHPLGKGSVFSISEPGNLLDALKVVQPGEQIILQEGTYYVRNVNLKKLGSDTKPIVISGKNAIISGLDTAQINWQPVNGQPGMYFTTTTVLNPNLVYTDGNRLYPFRSLDELARNKIGYGFNSLAQPQEFDANMDGFYRNSSTNPLCNSNWQYPKLMYVKFRDGANPKDKNVKISAAGYAFNLDSCENMIFQNIKFCDYGVAPNPRAINLLNTNNIAFKQCIFSMNDIGILFSGASSKTVIYDCEFYDAMFDWSAAKIKATYDDYNPYSCVFPYYSRMLEKGAIIIQHGFTGRGIDISNSSFHDYAQAGHLSPPSVNKSNPNSYEIDFYRNHLYRCAEDGFEIDGDARNIRVFDNEFEQCNAPISLAIAQGGPVYIARNVFHHLKNDTFTTHPDLGLQITPGHPFKTNYGSHDTMGEVNFIHNTVDATGNNMALDFFSPGDWSKFRVWNNIFQSDDGFLMSYRTPYFMEVDMIRNLYFSTANQPKFRIDTNYYDASIWMTDTFNSNFMIFTDFNQVDLGFLYANPDFDPWVNNPYYLNSSSKAVRYGMRVDGITDKYSNYNYIGAFPWWQRESVEEYKKHKLVVYPNPNKSELRFITDQPLINAQIEIYGIDGRLLLSEKIESSNVALQHQLKSGTYTIKVQGDKYSYTAKFIVVQ
jgi:hypothetical protein